MKTFGVLLLFIAAVTALFVLGDWIVLSPSMTLAEVIRYYSTHIVAMFILVVVGLTCIQDAS